MKKMKKKEEQKNYREFYKTVTKRFFDEKLLTLLYEDEFFAMCNASNHCYLFFPYYIVDYAILLDQPNALRCMLDVFRYCVSIGNWDDEQFRKLTAIINDKLFNILKEVKEGTDLNGPSKFVDLELDKLILKYGKHIPENIADEFLNKYKKK